MPEWFSALIQSQVVQSASLITLTIAAVTAITLQILRNGPATAKLENDTREALDTSVQRELTRLADRIDAAEKRHLECEERYVELQQSSADTLRKLENEIAGLRSQLVQYQRTSIRMIRNRQEAPRDPPNPPRVRGKRGQA